MKKLDYYCIYFYYGLSNWGDFAFRNQLQRELD